MGPKGKPTKGSSIGAKILFQRARVILRLPKRTAVNRNLSVTQGTWRTEGTDAGLYLLDNNVAEAEALEFAGELVDFAQGVDRPAFAELAKDRPLRAS